MAKRLNLTATSRQEKIVLAHLDENVSDVLAEKINGGDKTLQQCWSYITAEARKLAQNGCACIEDVKVFGWAVHFFEEDEIKGKDYKEKPVMSKCTVESDEDDGDDVPTVAAPKAPKAPKAKKSKDTYVEQLSLLDLLGV